jgi:hypothetical protein
VSRNVPRKNLITGIAGCCPRAASGHAAAAPPSSVMNWRRLMQAVTSNPSGRKGWCSNDSTRWGPGGGLPSGRSPDWLKMKNPGCWVSAIVAGMVVQKMQASISRECDLAHASPPGSSLRLE